MLVLLNKMGAKVLEMQDWRNSCFYVLYIYIYELFLLNCLNLTATTTMALKWLSYMQNIFYSNSKTVNISSISNI